MRVLLLIALVGVLAICASAAAQPLTITPSPFDASGTAPLMMRNATAAPVRLEIIRFGRTVNGYSGIGWSGRFTIDTPDGRAGGHFYCPILFGRSGLVGSPACGYGAEMLFGQQIAAGGAVTVEALALECGACLQPALLDDTLFVFSEGARRPQVVRLLNGGVSAWPPGIYTARAEAGGRVETVRFVVAR